MMFLLIINHPQGITCSDRLFAGEIRLVQREILSPYQQIIFFLSNKELVLDLARTDHTCSQTAKKEAERSLKVQKSTRAIMWAHF